MDGVDGWLNSRDCPGTFLRGPSSLLACSHAWVPFNSASVHEYLPTLPPSPLPALPLLPLDRASSPLSPKDSVRAHKSFMTPPAQESLSLRDTASHPARLTSPPRNPQTPGHGHGNTKMMTDCPHSGTFTWTALPLFWRWEPR